MKFGNEEKKKKRNALTVVRRTPDLACLNALKIALRSCCVNEPCNLKTKILIFNIEKTSEKRKNSLKKFHISQQ